MLKNTEFVCVGVMDFEPDVLILETE